MAWESIIGQQHAKDLLRSAVRSGEVAHAYLFFGAKGVGKEAVALEFAKVLNCEKKSDVPCDKCLSCNKIASLSHPDVKIIVALPAGKAIDKEKDPIESLSAQQVAELKEQYKLKSSDPYHEIQLSRAFEIRLRSVQRIKWDASLAPSEGRRKIYIISNADLMNDQSSNALLKTLEEPPQDTVLILTTSQKEALLPTIVSRCRAIHFRSLADEEIVDALSDRVGLARGDATIIAGMAGGSYSVARTIAGKDIGAEREKVTNFFRAIVAGDHLHTGGIINELCEEKDRRKIKAWLAFMQSWLRDALFLSAGRQLGDNSSSYATTLERFVKNFPNADITDCLKAVDEAAELIDRYMLSHLVLTSLTIRIQQLIGMKRKL